MESHPAVHSTPPANGDVCERTAAYIHALPGNSASKATPPLRVKTLRLLDESARKAVWLIRTRCCFDLQLYRLSSLHN